MADFSFLSDTDESAVEELISQATDLSVLEQVAAINCSGFSDSVLPTELEARFSRLKSFPSSGKSGSRTDFGTSSVKGGTGLKSDDEAAGFSPSKQNPCGKTKGGFRFSPGEQSPDGENGVSSPSKRNPSGGTKKNDVFSPGKEDPGGNFDGKNVIFSPSKQTPNEKNPSHRTPKSGALSSPSSNSSSSSADSPTPPRKSGCFWCSPKSLSNKKSKKELTFSKKDDILSDLSIFSEKSQRKILKKAMKEEEKINREAEKIVKWAKQASARMNLSDIEDELSDDERFK